MSIIRPRDAATLVLIRRDSSKPRILMGCRARQHDFMPSKWVFPGGRIDRADYHGVDASDLRPRVAQDLAATARLQRQNGQRLARALARTAIRETFEETGLVLGAHGDDGITGNLGALSYIARAITPPASPKRFDARFLMADASALHSLDAADSRELADVAWFTLEECRELDLPTVTRAVIDVVDKHLRGQQTGQPFWRWTRSNPERAL